MAIDPTILAGAGTVAGSAIGAAFGSFFPGRKAAKMAAKEAAEKGAKVGAQVALNGSADRIKETLAVVKTFLPIMENHMRDDAVRFEEIQRSLGRLEGQEDAKVGSIS